MNILILMAGSDKDFCEKGYPKYLIEQHYVYYKKRRSG